jgi:hypothetical protein
VERVPERVPQNDEPRVPQNAAGRSEEFESHLHSRPAGPPPGTEGSENAGGRYATRTRDLCRVKAQVWADRTRTSRNGDGFARWSPPRSFPFRSVPPGTLEPGVRRVALLGIFVRAPRAFGHQVAYRPRAPGRSSYTSAAPSGSGGVRRRRCGAVCSSPDRIGRSPGTTRRSLHPARSRSAVRGRAQPREESAVTSMSPQL